MQQITPSSATACGKTMQRENSEGIVKTPLFMETAIAEDAETSLESSSYSCSTLGIGVSFDYPAVTPSVSAANSFPVNKFTRKRERSCISNSNSIISKLDFHNSLSK